MKFSCKYYAGTLVFIRLERYVGSSTIGRMHIRPSTIDRMHIRLGGHNSLIPGTPKSPSKHGSGSALKTLLPAHFWCGLRGPIVPWWPDVPSTTGPEQHHIIGLCIEPLTWSTESHLLVAWVS